MKYHIVYRTHNLVNGKEYTGKHSTNDLSDGYYGSGRLLKKAVAKYGLENFAVEILSIHETSDAAYLEEARIVDEEYIEREDTYNERLGGEGGWDYINSNSLNNSIQNIIAIDDNSNTYRVNRFDSRYLSGKLFGIMKNRVTVKDKDSNTLSVSVNDPRYLSGELVHHTYGTISVKDRDGNTFRVDKNDPRYLSGELVGVTAKTKFKMTKQSQAVCPHCGKSGRATNIKRWHFDNCKSLNTLNDV